MGRLRLLIEERGWSQVQAAERLGIGQSRVSNLMRGKWEKFSLDMLIPLAARAGKRVELALDRISRPSLMHRLLRLRFLNSINLDGAAFVFAIMI